MKITNFTRQEHRRLSAAVVAALKQVGDDFGVDLTAAGGQYGDSGYVKIAVALRDTGSGVSGAKATWDKYAAILGLEKEWFGQPIIIDRSAYEIIGIQPNKPKYAVQIKRCHDGKVFGTTVLAVQSQLRMKAAA